VWAITDLIHFSQGGVETIPHVDLGRISPIILERMSEAIGVVDQDLRYIWVNPAFRELTQYSDAEILGQSVSLLRSDHHSEAFYFQMYQAVVTEGEWQGELLRRRKNGDPFAIFLKILKISRGVPAPPLFIDIFSEIGATTGDREHLEFLVNHDALTELPNARLFWDRLHNALERARRNPHGPLLLFIDLDDFKALNDAYGHLQGDQVLVAVARALVSVTRAGDTLARVGGDEFVALIEEGDEPCEPEATAHRIQAAIRDVGRHLAMPMDIEASIGIAIHPRDGAEAATLYSQADRSMYERKRQR